MASVDARGAGKPPALSVDAPIALAPGEIADPGGLAAYLSEALGIDGQVEFFKFTAGNANLTYLVRGGGREFVLKREPPGRKAKSAHDMRREHRVLAALEGRYPMAPRALLLCEDPAVLGGAFLVMERIQGVIVRQASAAALDDGQARRQFLALISALAELHALDVGEEPLRDLGRPEGYVARQVEGWRKRMAAAGTPDAPAVDDIEDWLAIHMPATARAGALVHNDFKLDNLVWDADEPTKLLAVLDWEMATLGDPFMDLGVTLSFWVEPEDPPGFKALRAMPSGRPGVPTRADAWRAYASQRGESSDDYRFYLCFALYRRAVIEQQKYFRFRSGQTDDARYADLNVAVEALIEMCRRQMRAPTPA